MQPVALKKTGSNTKKHHKYALLLAIYVYEILQKRMKKVYMEIISTCTKTLLLIETLTEEILTVAMGEAQFECKDESNQCSVF